MIKPKNKRLNFWIKRVLENANWENYDSIHIDEIYTSVRKNNHWLDASLITFEYVINLIDVNIYQVVLAIPLQTKKTEYNINKFNKLNIIDKFISKNTPPCFYLFEKSDFGILEFKRSLLLCPYLNFNKHKFFLKKEKNLNRYDGTLFLFNYKDDI